MNQKPYSDRILRSIAEILRNESKIATAYYKKWGISPGKISSRLSDEGLHGGASSKIRSLKVLNLESIKSVLDIGPETGFEVFMWCELGKNVIVCDPDKQVLFLIKKISEKYRTQQNVPAQNSLTFVPAGLGNSREVIAKEKHNLRLLKRINKTGMPTYYYPTSTKLIKNFRIKVDLIYIHKILQTISRSSRNSAVTVFRESLKILWPKVKEGGCLTWIEPAFLFHQKSIRLDQIRDLGLGEKNLRVFKYRLGCSREEYCQILLCK